MSRKNSIPLAFFPIADWPNQSWKKINERAFNMCLWQQGCNLRSGCSMISKDVMTTRASGTIENRLASSMKDAVRYHRRCLCLCYIPSANSVSVVPFLLPVSIQTPPFLFCPLTASWFSASSSYFAVFPLFQVQATAVSHFWQHLDKTPSVRFPLLRFTLRGTTVTRPN